MSQHYEFYYFIANKVPSFGKTEGLLFDFTANVPPTKEDGPVSQPNDEELEGANTDPALTKVVDRRWYEKNKHIFPASLWREYEPGEDFLEKMLNAQEAEPEKISLMDVHSLGQTNVGAGSDTTALSLSAILYYLIKSPHILRRLRKEITEKGNAGATRITYKESLEMPYFQAVMKEALRFVIRQCRPRAIHLIFIIGCILPQVSQCGESSPKVALPSATHSSQPAQWLASILGQPIITPLSSAATQTFSVLSVGSTHPQRRSRKWTRTTCLSAWEAEHV